MDIVNNLGIYAIKGQSPYRGVKQSSDFIKRRTSSLKGKKRTIETRRKISLSKQGQKAWNKGLKTGIKTLGMSGMKHSEETKNKMSQMHKGIIFTDKWKAKLGNKQQDHWNWKGGITPVNQQIRKSKEYILWRVAVFMRDDYTCVWCGSKEKIEADHIKQFAYYPELRFAIDNGRTLCHDCHTKTDTYLRRL